MPFMGQGRGTILMIWNGKKKWVDPPGHYVLEAIYQKNVRSRQL